MLPVGPAHRKFEFAPESEEPLKMEKFGDRPVKGKLIGGILLSLLVGILSPYLLVFLPLFLSPVLLGWIGARFGLPAAVAGVAAALFSTAALLGWPMAAWTLAALYAPLICAFVGIRRQWRFEDQLGRCIATSILCLTLAVALARFVVGEDLVSYLARLLENMLNELPSEVLDSFLLAGNSAGLFSASQAGGLTSGIYTLAQRQEMIAQIVDSIRSLYETGLPGLLLFGAGLTGILLAAIPNRHLVRRGALPRECYWPLAKWHLSVKMTFGLLAVFLGILILDVSDRMEGMSAISFAGEALLTLFFGLQAVGSLERRLIAGNLRPGTRVALIVLMVVLLSPGRILTFYGMISALAGPHYGAIPQILRSRRNGEDS